MVGVRVFVTAEHHDYLKLLEFQSALVSIKQGRLLRQVRVFDTGRRPQSIADLVEKTRIQREWKYKTKEWVSEFYGIFDFKVPDEGLWYVRPVVQSILRSCVGSTDVKEAEFSFSLPGASKARQSEVLDRCFPPLLDD